MTNIKKSIKRAGLHLGAFFFSASLGIAGPTASMWSVQDQWMSDSGEKLRLDAFKGKWTVLSMMYTSCTSSCPLIVKKMRGLESQIKNKTPNVQFVLVTFDPSRDTPSNLKKYRERTGIVEKNWHFLSGSDLSTRRLSMHLGIKYARDAKSGDFTHDNKIVLLSPEGQIVARLNSLGDSDDEFVTAVGVKK